MLLRVREHDNEVHIEVSGVAGRQTQVLEAISQCQKGSCGCGGALASRSDVHVRSRTNDMRIRLRSDASQHFDPADVYRCMRRALIERPAQAAEAAVAAVAAAVSPTVV